MQNEITSLKRFKVLGISTDFNTCECCGKTDLSKVVRILDLESEVILNFGTTCAASANKYDTLEAAKLAKKDIDKEVRKYSDVVKSANMMMFRVLRELFGVVRLSDNSVKVNCSDEIINDCHKKALAHILNDRANSRATVFKYEE
jgi:hypothetical protein